MVSKAPGRVVSPDSLGMLLKRGAESEIRLGTYMGVKAVYKLRVRKEYMHPKLDSMLRAQRTRREARVLLHARSHGATVPRVLAVYPSMGLIVMEYIEGATLKRIIDENTSKPPLELVREAGRQLGILHRSGIVHGDPTTSNYILSDGGALYIIDFGLADFSAEIEDRAVDLHLFRRAVESTHAPVAGALYKAFLEGYLGIMGVVGEEVSRRADEIRLRGRYVEARRATAWRFLGEG